MRRGPLSLNAKLRGLVDDALPNRSTRKERSLPRELSCLAGRRRRAGVAHRPEAAAALTVATRTRAVTRTGTDALVQLLPAAAVAEGEDGGTRATRTPQMRTGRATTTVARPARGGDLRLQADARRQADAAGAEARAMTTAATTTVSLPATTTDVPARGAGAAGLRAPLAGRRPLREGHHLQPGAAAGGPRRPRAGAVGAVGAVRATAMRAILRPMTARTIGEESARRAGRRAARPAEVAGAVGPATPATTARQAATTTAAEGRADRPPSRAPNPSRAPSPSRAPPSPNLANRSGGVAPAIAAARMRALAATATARTPMKATVTATTIGAAAARAKRKAARRSPRRTEAKSGAGSLAKPRCESSVSMVGA